MKIILIIATLIIMSSCSDASLSEQIGRDVKTITEDFNKGYKPTEREYFGMTATIIYLQETNQLDSVTIDIHRLLQIQDSLSNKQ